MIASNTMISHAIWGHLVLLNFSRTTNCTHPTGACKLHSKSCYYTCTDKINSEKLARKIGATKCSYCDQTCHIEKENKFHMVCDMMIICPLVDYDIHVYSRSIPNSSKLFRNRLFDSCLCSKSVDAFYEANCRLASQKGLIQYQ